MFANDCVTVLYIVGQGRSGSTLLGRALGEMDGFFSGGELGLAWERSFRENQLCGCGAAFAKCNFWEGVVADAFGGTGKVDLERIFALRQRTARTRHIPFLLSGWLQLTPYRDALCEFTEILGRFYAAIKQQAGARIIVDSTKLPLYGLLLCNVPNLKIYAIHLVRNSQAVAYSWQRKRIRPEIQGKVEYMPRPSLYESAKAWNKSNSIALMLRWSASKYVLLRYEDFVANPEAAIERIFSKFCIKGDVGPIWNGNTFLFHKISHTVSGNPMRFRKGEVVVREDEEWRTKLSYKDKLLVRTLTAPLSKVLGY